jgi:aromatic ring-opening dioxygenase LigB subunit
VSVDVELATRALTRAAHDGLPVVGASFGANDPTAATAPMDWGVLIPVWAMAGGRPAGAVVSS